MTRIALTRIAALLVPAVLSPALGWAKPFDPTMVPETVGWAVHVDAHAVSSGPLWAALEPALRDSPRIGRALQMAERALQVKLPDDVDDVTIFGTDVDGVGFAAVVRSKANPQRLATLASMYPTYAKHDVAGRTVHAWTDAQGRDRFASFGPHDELVVSGDESLLAATCDLLAHKDGAKSLDGQMPFAPKPTDAVTIYLGGGGLGKLIARNKDASIFLQPVRRAWLTAHEENDHVQIDGQVLAIDAKSADLLRNLVEGARSFTVLASRTELPIEGKVRRAGELLSSFDSHVTGDRIDFEWTLPSAMLQSAAEDKLEQR